MKRSRYLPSNSLQFLMKIRSVNRSNASSGFTLIESLVAIIVVSITVVAISPPIFWAAGTRVQNRRAEQALAIAQGTIDEVRAKVERGSYNLEELPGEAPPKAGGIRPFPPAPAASAQWARAKRCSYRDSVKQKAQNTIASLLSTENNYPPIDQYLAVDLDGESGDSDPNNPKCEPEFLVQVFRNRGICSNGPCIIGSSDKPVAFSVGVRVYSVIAKQSTLPLKEEKASLTGSTGTGQSGFRPLAVLYATVAKTHSSNALNRYRELCQASSEGSKACE